MADAEPVAPGEVLVGRRDRLGVGALEQVEGVTEAADRQEQAAVLGVLLEDLEAQQAGIEVLRFLEITHRDEDVTQALQLDHCSLSRGGKTAPASIHASPAVARALSISPGG